VTAALCVALAMAMAQAPAVKETKPMEWPASIQVVLRNAQPLKHPRGKRLPLYLWPAMNPGTLSDVRAAELVRELDRRGVGLVCRWDPAHMEASLAAALPVARAQAKVGHPVAVDATACLSSFFDGSPETAHLDAAGERFWDGSFVGKPDMGCPFALEGRKEPIRRRVEAFAEAYRRAGLSVGFCFADWEIDGPIEWNGAWASSKRCTRCRAHVGDVDNFPAYQKIIRETRADLQRECYSEPLKERFPGILVGNYGVYPNDGFRYWYDYFEPMEQPGPMLADQRARYRHWAPEFERSGYTFAMPVTYPWSRIWGWYDHEPGDYRWFYNMLKVGTNAAEHTPPSAPIITFVHWHTIEPSKPPEPQMSEQAYRELLWHLILRGHATFFLWCMEAEQAKEVELLHGVWADALQYGEFLEKGRPVAFEAPGKPGAVLSALRLGNRLLVRRTDFGPITGAVKLRVAGRDIDVPPSPGRCAVLTLPTEAAR
jgi:hypothetical protein